MNLVKHPVVSFLISYVKLLTDSGPGYRYIYAWCYMSYEGAESGKNIHFLPVPCVKLVCLFGVWGGLFWDYCLNSVFCYP